MTLVEILIALFIFLLGILGVLSMFPVAMRTASDAMGNTRGVILARSALAQVTADARITYPLIDVVAHPTYDDVRVAAVTTTTLQAEAHDTGTGLWANPPGWMVDQWIGYYVTMIDGPCQWQSRRIVSNTADTLTVPATEPWNPVPDLTLSGDIHFVITRLGLPAPVCGQINALVGAGSTTITITGANWADDQWNGYTIHLLDPNNILNNDKERTITATSSPNTLTIDEAWPADLAAGDEFIIYNLQPRDGYVREIDAGKIRAGVQHLTAVPRPTVNVRSWPATLWKAPPGVPAYTLPHFLLITSGRATGRLFVINGHDPHANGDELDCGVVNWDEIGVREAHRGANHHLQNATSFRIIGTEGAIASVIPCHFTVESGTADLGSGTGTLVRDGSNTPVTPTNAYFLELTSGDGKGQIRSISSNTGTTLNIAPDWSPFPPPPAVPTWTQPVSGDKYRIWTYRINTFPAAPGTKETGPDTYTDADGDEQIASEYSTICIFSNSGPLAAERVQADIFVYRNFDGSKSLIENQKPVAHITGYIGRP